MAQGVEDPHGKRVTVTSGERAKKIRACALFINQQLTCSSPFGVRLTSKIDDRVFPASFRYKATSCEARLVVHGDHHNLVIDYDKSKEYTVEDLKWLSCCITCDSGFWPLL